MIQIQRYKRVCKDKSVSLLSLAPATCLFTSAEATNLTSFLLLLTLLSPHVYISDIPYILLLTFFT